MTRNDRAVESSPPAKDRPLILMVERDPHVREFTAHFLQQAGYSVEFATDGRLALEQARQARPHLLITEILVPRLDGLALCRQLKVEAETRDIPVLIFSILTASARAREAGADAFLMKPLLEHRLLPLVRELLAKRSGVSPKEQP